MIYYFSGTGNSEWVAKQMARELNEEVMNIPKAMKERTSIIIKKGQVVGLVFPIYAWAPPEMVLDFLKSITIEEGAFCYAVCTCGDEAGLAMKKLAKYIPLNSAYSIMMPNNYIIGFDVDSEEVAKEKIQQAKNKLPKICLDIRAKEKVWDVEMGKMAFVKSTVAAFVFNKFGRSSKPFIVQDNCNSCGLCEKVCPTENIKMETGNPAWGKHCLQCLACINRCPKKAIQYGKVTKNKGRYYFRSER